MFDKTSFSSVGVEVAPPNPEELTREFVITLFDAVIEQKMAAKEKRFRDYAIFKASLGDTEEMHEAFSRFLPNVTTCPERVIHWCQEFLRTNP